MTPDILYAASLCAASYDLSDTRFTTVDELRYGVIANEGTRYVVNRGTSNAAGWLDDLDVIPIMDEDGSLVHAGFLHAALKVLPYILADLAKTPGNETIFCGHSLGAAMACLQAKRIKGPVITFGSPRSQMQCGTDPTPITHYRIVIDSDIVTHVPDGELWDHTVRPYINLSHPGDPFGAYLHAPLDLAYIPRMKSVM